MRISREQMFMIFARGASLRSTCYRGNAGAVIVMDNNPVSIGYNGPPSGEEHCKGNACELNAGGGCLRSDHAEINAIKRLPIGIELNSKTMYITTSPCPACAEAILDRQDIETVIFENEYRIPDGWKMLIGRIAVFRLSPAGYLINMRTNEVTRT